MKSSDIPTKFVIPFGNNAVGTDIRPIPVTTTDPNAASLETGWPPATLTPISAGGSPPDGRDFNGLDKQTTAWARWLAAGAPIVYDPVFQADSNFGGYPRGAIVQSATTFGKCWISTTDDNLTDPDASGAGWEQYPFPLPLSMGNGGTGNTAFTAGAVVFSDGTKLVGSPTQLFWNFNNNRLGIGTSTPAYQLHVAGTSAFDSGVNIGGNLGVAGTGSFTGAGSFGNGLTVSGSALVVGAQGISSAGTLNIVASASDSGIGITCPEPTIVLVNTGAGGTRWVNQFSSINQSLNWSYQAIGLMILANNGDLFIQGTLTQSSDARLKKNIADIPSAIGYLMKLRPVTFEMIDGSGLRSGLIAQEVQDVIPSLVREKGDDEKTLSVAYGDLVAYLLRGIQEMKEEIELLRSEIVTMKNG